MIGRTKGTWIIQHALDAAQVYNSVPREKAAFKTVEKLAPSTLYGLDAETIGAAFRPPTYDLRRKRMGKCEASQAPVSSAAAPTPRRD